MAELIFHQHGRPMMRFPLNKGSIKIGRSVECDITLADELISRVHLILYQSENSFLAKGFAENQFGYNGKMVSMASLQKGDRLTLGNWEVHFSENHVPDWSRDDTYVSCAGGEATKVLHASLTAGCCHLERLELLISESGHTQRTCPITQETTTLGKASSCDLVLSDSYCSDVHAKIVVRGNKVEFLDLRSTNGSFVNGVRVKEAELEEGNQIQLGETQLVLRAVTENREIKPLEADSFGPLIGGSLSMRELYSLIQQVAPTDAPVCIFGETGTGKELVAAALHDLSPRRKGPWVALNCGAISRELIASELFGHEKGAFTGAHQQRLGAFEQAHHGTLFLDEIGELPLDLQPALLRVLETGKLRRVGGGQEISVDVRVVCATHRDLSKWVEEKKFREDLFFRLYVFPLFLSPLRERREDILPLTRHFLKTMTPPGKALDITPDVARHLESQEWKGNVRELKNVIQRAIVLAKEGKIDIAELNFPGRGEIASPPNSSPLSSISNLQEIEKQIILRELRVQEGNRLATAKALGIAKSTLYEKLKQYGIQ